MNYLLHILVLANIFILLASSLDLLVGRLGLLSMAHAIFYGIGAYTGALLAVHFGTPFLVGLLAGMAMAAVISTMVSLPLLRLHGDYFVMATFAFQMILHSVFNNWMAVTRGPLGIQDIPRPVILGWVVESTLDFVVLTTLLTVVGCTLLCRISSSPLGRVLHAIRENEKVAQSLGKNTVRMKVGVFAVSASCAGGAGVLYAYYVSYIDPSSFTVMESILVITMIIVGGAGTVWGPIVGAVALVSIPEVLRFTGMPGSASANLRQILYGAMLVSMMLMRPKGLIGRYSFGRQ